MHHIGSSLFTIWDESPSVSNVRQRLYQVLRQSIIRMVLEPGRALSEKEVAEAFGVSRQPVREAFIRLSESGLLEIRPQRGSYVVRISHEAVLEARFVREAIEIAVAESATKQGLDEGVINELRELIELQKQCTTPQDFDRFFQLDEGFHRTLSLGAGHTSAWRVTEEVKAQLDRVRYLSGPDTTPLPKLIDQHTQIVDAIAEGDVERAVLVMRAHQREILLSLPDLVQRFPEMFEGDLVRHVQAISKEQ